MLTDMKRQMMQSDLHMREEHSGQVQIIGKKIIGIRLTANVDKEILKGYFSQNKKENSLCVLLGRTQGDDPAVIKLVDKAYIFPLSHKFI